MADEPPSFWARLKQHHIYRVVTVYAIVAWILIQVSNAMFPDFGLPRGDVRVLIVVLLLGFPVVLVVAWMLIKPRDPAQYTRWQKLHWKLGSALALVLLILVVISGLSMWRYTERHPLMEATGVQNVSTQVTPAFDPPADSLVVLPFTDLGNDPTQKFFSDGVTEELTNALGKNPALRVIAWETASTFRNSKQTAMQVGKALNVANLLHGSILREGDRVRVTAELVNTVTGYQLWSAHYDNSLKNIFVVQDQISAAIAGALQIKFAATQAAPSVNPQAHALVLKSLAGMHTGSAASLATARHDLERAVALAPTYADAYGLLAHVYYTQSQVSTLPVKEALPKARAAANRALQLDPRNVNALVSLGLVDAYENHLARAKREYQQALALDPSYEVAHLDYGTILPLKSSLAQEQEAVLLNPHDVVAQYNLADDYMDLQEYQQALVPALAATDLSPDVVDSAFQLAFLYQQLHQLEASVTAFDLVKPASRLDKRLVEAGRLTYQALLKPELRAHAMKVVNKLRRTKLSPNSVTDLVQLYLALGENESAMQLLPDLCTSSVLACNDLGINPVYKALHTDPRFQTLAKRYTTVTLE